METEDKRRAHPTGHENRAGRHVCHRCGWAFPNPHPSPKHRRAHKKHCGQIEGFNLLDDSNAAAVSRCGGGEDNNGVAMVSGEDHEKPGEPASEELKPEEETEKTEKGGCGVGEVPGEVHDSCNDDSASEADNSDADKTLEPCNQPHSNKTQGFDVKSVEDQLENGTQLGNNALFYNTTVNATTEHEETSAFTHLKEALLLDSPVEKTCHTTAQNVVATSVITDLTDAKDNADTNAVMELPSVLTSDLATDALDKDSESHMMDRHTEIGITSGNRAMDVPSVLPSDLATDALDKDSESHMMDGHTEIGITSGISATGGTVPKDMPDETSVEMNVLDAKAALPQGEQIDAAGCDSQNELFPCTESCPVEINAGEHTDDSFDVAQIEYLTDIADDRIVKGDVKENLTALLVLSNVPRGEISEMNHRLHQDHEPSNSNLPLIYAGVEAGKEQTDHLGGTDLKVVQSEMTPMSLDGSANVMPSSMQLLHKETESRTVIAELNDNHNVTDAHDNMEGSPFVKNVGGATDVSCSKFNVHEDLVSDGLDPYPHASIGESLETQAIALDASVVRSCGIDVATIQLEVEIDSSFEGQESCHESLNEISGDHVVVADAGGDAVSDTASQASEATKQLNGCQQTFYEETEVIPSEIVGFCRQETSNEDSCQSDTRPDPEPTSHISESELPYVDNKRENELEICENVMSSAVHSSVSGSEATHICPSHMEKSGPCLDKLNLQEVIEKRTVEPAVDNDTDHHVTQTEVYAKYIKAESSLLDHQKVQIMNLPYSGELDHQKDIQGISIEPAVIDNTDHPFTHTRVQIKHIERENSPGEQPYEEPKNNENNEVNLCHHDELKFGLEEHTTPLVDTQAAALIPVTLDNSKTSDISEVVSSGTCDQFLQDGVIHIACRQHSDAANVAADASGDSNSQTDSVEGRWGSVSDVAVLSLGDATDGAIVLIETVPAISNQTPNNPHASDPATKGGLAECNTDNMGLFEAPSFMTLVEPAKQREIQPTRTLQESQGKKKNEDIIEKVVKWDSEKPHTPLKHLLAEASFMVKNDRDGGPTTMTLGSEIASEYSSKSSSNRADHKEWNSPARLPVRKDEKRKVKGKSTWVPFICCSYVN